MKISTLILAATASAALIACSASGETDTSADVVAATQDVAPVAVIDAALEGPIYTKLAGETLALSGYDAVSYFGEDGPAEGSAEHTVTYQGYDYHFASAENAETFAADPAKYAPQYGGYCAWAIGANDALAPGDPEVYKIVDGKLYLNFSENVAKRWNTDIPGFIEKGDANYPTHSPDEHYMTN